MPDWGRICGAIAKRFKGRPKSDAWNYLNAVTTHYDLVYDKIGGRIGRDLPINESLLQHSLVVGAVQRLLYDSQQAREAA